MSEMLGNTRGLKWVPAHDDALRACLSKNMSLAAAAAFINGEFGTSYTRNSSIGRAHRLGIKSENPVGKHHGNYKRASLAEPKRERRRTLPVFEVAREPLRCDEVEPLHLSLSDLSPNDCRWPFGLNIPYTFCGRPKAARWYCAAHQELSTGKGTASERRAGEGVAA